MASSFEKPITIEHAIQQIDARKYLLPSIQRNFTWSTEQICVLFDSLMRNYPINSLMLWQVNSREVAEGFSVLRVSEAICREVRREQPHLRHARP